MSDDGKKPDPFAAYESDRTIIKPGAGARGRTAGAAATPAAPFASPAIAPACAPVADGWHGAAAERVFTNVTGRASLNPLVQAAAPLLTAAPRLRAMPRHPNPQALRASLVESIKQFESAARALSLPNEQVLGARYVICTLLDESAASTPWGAAGGAGGWSAHSLLVQFHNETWGGEKVFQLLTRLAENADQHRNLLELIYVALSLGFEGRYRVLDNGRAQLDSLRERLAQMLRQLSGPPERDLSTQWQGVAGPPVRLRDGIPLWVVGVAVAALLLIVFMAMSMHLGNRTDPIFSALSSLQVKAARAAPAAAQAQSVAVAPRLAQLLKSDIDAGNLQVRDLADRSVVTVLGDSLFESGSGDVVSRAEPLFGRIAAALHQLPGRVLISGHTDNQAIRSLRYQSNWHLSVARAQSVLRLLARTVPPARLASEGRAETEPVADNGSPEGRARNRRVEIVLTVAAPS